MLNNMAILSAAVLLMAGLLHFETRESTLGKLLTKTPLSILFIVTALLQPHPDQWYFHFIFIALFFCLAGDVFLALPMKRTFLFGLVAFLIGHILYIIAFTYLADVKAWANMGTPIILIVSAVVYGIFRPHLKDMTYPVLVYVIVISLMLCGALAVLLTPADERLGPVLVFTGALLFYLSDLFVARDRFMGRSPVNRWIGLPLYYGGQFMLAFSVGLFG
jgi:uncharacterized membrane protein YhhN